jgi:hypothetical protein
MSEVIKNVGFVRLTVAWKEELVGDEADTDRFYLRLRPSIRQRISLHNTRAIADYTKKKLQEELNKLKDKK